MPHGCAFLSICFISYCMQLAEQAFHRAPLLPAGSEPKTCPCALRILPSKPARPTCVVCYANTGIIIRIKSKFRIKLVKLVTEGVRLKPSVLTILSNKMKLSFKHSYLEHLKLQVSILLTLNRKCSCSSTQQRQQKMSVFINRGKITSTAGEILCRISSCPRGSSFF